MQYRRAGTKGGTYFVTDSSSEVTVELPEPSGLEPQGPAHRLKSPGKPLPVIF